jgi:hypothetical protein
LDGPLEQAGSKLTVIATNINTATETNNLFLVIFFSLLFDLTVSMFSETKP